MAALSSLIEWYWPVERGAWSESLHLLGAFASTLSGAPATTQTSSVAIRASISAASRSAHTHAHIAKRRSLCRR